MLRYVMLNVDNTTQTLNGTEDLMRVSTSVHAAAIPARQINSRSV